MSKFDGRCKHCGTAMEYQDSGEPYFIGGWGCPECNEWYSDEDIDAGYYDEKDEEDEKEEANE